MIRFQAPVILRTGAFFMMMKIELQNLHFHALHGVYAEEKILGNDFVVNVSVEYIPDAVPVIELAQTINYEGIFKLLQERMKKPTPLLETLVSQIAMQIAETYESAERVEVRICKKKPPVEGWNGDVEVSFSWKRPKRYNL